MDTDDETYSRSRKVPGLIAKGIRSRRGTAVVGGLVVLVAVMVGSMAVVACSSSQSASSSRSASQSPSASSTGSAYYDDGIPRAWEGQPVLRGQAALDAAKASTDQTPFYVAFWAGYPWSNSCPPVQTDPEALFLCGAELNVGDQPGVESAVSRLLGNRLRLDVLSIAPAPIIARVHTHDPNCPAAAGLHCDLIMVGDVVWHGGDTTAPAPVTVDQAAAAFGITTETYKYPLNLCPVSTLPGIPMLSLWKGALPTAPLGPVATLPDGIVAVFPSPQSLAAAFPDVVAKGELNLVAGGNDVCQAMNDQGMRWMAKANILVGVAYDDAHDPDTDPLVLKARAALATLGN